MPVINGYFASIEVADVPAFQNELLRYVHSNYSEILTNIQTSRILDKDTEELLIKAINECIESFGTSHHLITSEEA